MNALLVAQSALASAPDPADVKPGWVALVIVLLMGLATFLLWRSMNHQLKKVDFDNGSVPPDSDADAPDTGDNASR